jgi:hypothetical protein
MNILRDLWKSTRNLSLSLCETMQQASVASDPLGSGAFALPCNPGASFKQRETTRDAAVIPARYRSREDMRTVETLQSELQSVRGELAQLETEYSGKQAKLFAVERSTRDLLAKEFEPQIRQRRATIQALEQELSLHSINSQFELVDIAFLKLLKVQDGTKLPKFVLFDTKRDRFALRTDCWVMLDADRKGISIPEEVADLFDISGLQAFGKEFLEQEQAKENEAGQRRQAARESRTWESGPQRVRRTHVSIAAQYGGQLPAAVRQKIVANSDGFDQYYLVLEAPEWVISCRNAAMPVKTCRKALALIGKKGDRYWLVTETAVEQP